MSEPYKSTRVNPDKYIDKLKGQIERLEEMSKDHWRRHGIHEFTYKRGACNLSVALNNPMEHEKLLPGTEVIFKGSVTEVHRTLHDSSIKFNVSMCKRVKTREIS